MKVPCCYLHQLKDDLCMQLHAAASCCFWGTFLSDLPINHFRICLTLDKYVHLQKVPLALQASLDHKNSSPSLDHIGLKNKHLLCSPTSGSNEALSESKSMQEWDFIAQSHNFRLYPISNVILCLWMPYAAESITCIFTSVKIPPDILYARQNIRYLHDILVIWVKFWWYSWYQGDIVVFSWCSEDHKFWWKC